MQNHYIIGKKPSKDGEKLFLGRVERVHRGILEGYLEKNAHLGGNHKTQFEIPQKDIVVDLGTDPRSGSVYGFDVTNRFYKKKHHEYFGNISFMYKADKETAKKIFAAFDEAAKILKRHGITVDTANCSWQILHKDTKGKWAGWYKHSPDTEKTPYQFAIKPESVPVTEFVYVVLHEIAHYIHKVRMTGTKLNARWIRLFNTSIKLQTFKKEVMQSLLQELVGGETRPSEFKSDLEEEQALAYTWALRLIKADHAVSVKELDILFEADEKDEIAKLWPSRSIHKKDLAPVVSEYATTNYHELIAESIAFHLTKRKLPAPIAALVEKSLSFAKANQGGRDND